MVLDQHAYTTVEQFNEITVHRQTCYSTWTHYTDFEPTSLCLLLLSGAYLAEKQQIPNLQFDLANLYNTQVVIGRLKIRLMNFKLIHFSCTLVPLLKRPSLLEWKSGLIRGVASLEKDHLVVFYYQKLWLIIGGAFPRSDIIKGELMFTYLH